MLPTESGAPEPALELQSRCVPRKLNCEDALANSGGVRAQKKVFNIHEGFAPVWRIVGVLNVTKIHSDERAWVFGSCGVYSDELHARDINQR
jgi:hypothetical protein